MLLLGACGASDDSTTKSAAPRDDNGVTAIGRCLQEDGWDVSVDKVDRSIEFKGTPDQASAYDDSYRSCKKKFGTPEIAFEDYSDAMRRDLYRQEKATAACLRDRGYEIPVVPSFDTYIERLPSDDPWTSYSFLPEDIGQDTLHDLNAACPQPG